MKVSLDIPWQDSIFQPLTEQEKKDCTSEQIESDAKYFKVRDEAKATLKKGIDISTLGKDISNAITEYKKIDPEVRLAFLNALHERMKQTKPSSKGLIAKALSKILRNVKVSK